MREARSGDRYLLCSDGLSGVVSAETLAEALTIADPQDCSDRLIELALKGGGPDNVTCIVADVVDVDYGEHDPIYGGAAGDGRADRPPGDSAAARASAATLTRSEPEPRPAPAVSETPRRGGAKRGRLRLALAALAVVAIARIAVIAAKIYVDNQYYVASSGDQVAIYQGVPGTFLGVTLQEVVENPGLRVADLTPVARQQLSGDGIRVEDLDGARATVARLGAEQMLPPCRPAVLPGAVPPAGARSPGPRPPPPPAPPVRPRWPRPPRPSRRSRGGTAARCRSGAPDRSGGAGPGAPGAPGIERPADRTALRPAVAAAVSTRRGVELALLALRRGHHHRRPGARRGQPGAGADLDAALPRRGLPRRSSPPPTSRCASSRPTPTRSCCPLAALLNGLGLVMIHRVDLARIARAASLGNDEPAAGGAAPGRLDRGRPRVLRRRARARARPPHALAVRLHRRVRRPGAARPARGAARLALGGQRRPHLDPARARPASSPASSRRSCSSSSSRRSSSSSATCSPRAGKRFLGMTFPRPRDLGPLLVAWGVAMAVLVFESDLGTSLMFFGIVLVMLYVATERISWVIIGLIIFGAGAFAAWTFVSRVQIRVSVWLDPFADYNGRGFQVSQGLFGLATGGMGGTGLGAGPPGARAVREHRLHLHLARRGARASSGSRRCCCSTACSPPGRCAARWPCATRSASCSPPGLGLRHRVAGVRRRRRRHQPHPEHRHHGPVRVLRRVVAGGQLRARRAGAAGVQRGPPAGARQAPGPGARARRRSRPWPRPAPRWSRRDQVRTPTARECARSAAGPAAPPAAPREEGPEESEHPAATGLPRGHGAGPAAAGPGHLDPGRQGRRVPRRPPQRPRPARRVLPPARPDLAGGEVLAQSVESPDPGDRLRYLRQYTDGPLYAPVTGYYSQIYGAGGMERAMDPVLNGTDDRLFVRRISDADHRARPGGRQRRAQHRPADPARGLRGDDLAGATRARSWRSARRPARSSRWSPRRRTTRTRWPATRAPPSSTRGTRSPRTTRRRCRTARSARPTRPGRPSRSSTRRPRSRPGSSARRPR